jgi:hypothetical protein
MSRAAIRTAKLQRVRRRPEGEYKGPTDQHNAWEQQAEEAATRFTKNRPVGARWLTPSPAASYRAPASAGAPLPFHLRAELERGFNADLREVRIHRDAAATSAAREQNAIAFASGRDIFFDQGAASPDTQSGLELLAHEVAHVLQQTGREDSEGRLRATAVESFGEVQRKGEGSKLRRDLQLDFDKLADAHRGNADNADQFDELVTAVRSALGGTLDETSQSAADFEAAITSKDPKYWKYVQQSEVAAGFIFDVLKFIDRFAGAGVVLEQDLFLQTYAPLRDVAEYYATNVDKQGAYFDTIAAQHPLISGYWPKSYFDTFVVFLYGPSRDVPALTGPNGKSYKDAFKEYVADQSLKDVEDNELVLSVAADLGNLDKLRVQNLVQLQAEVGRSLDRDLVPVAFRSALAFKVRGWARQLQKDPLTVVQTAGVKIEAIAQGAIDYWTSVFNADLTFEVISAATGDDKQARTKRAIPHDKLFTDDIPDALSVAAGAIGKTKADGNLPDPSVYAAQVAAAVSGLKAFVRNQLEFKLIELARKGAIGDDFAVALGWFLLWFQETFQQAASYDPAKDKEFGQKFQGYPDVRFSHRLRLQRRTSGLVDQLVAGSLDHWKALRAQTDQVLQNKNEGRSRLSILGEWKAQRGAPIADMAKDYSSFAGILSPLTGAQLANLFLLVYFRDLTGELKTQMSNADQDFKDPRAALQKKSLLGQAVDISDARSRPVRYVASDWDYADNPNENQDIGEKDPVERAAVFVTLVQNHPKTQKLEQDEAANKRQLLYSRSPYSPETKELFLWSIPNLAAVFAVLRGMGTLNVIIATATGLALEEVNLLSDEAWIGWLMKSADIQAGITLALNTLLTQARTDLNDTFRAAVSHERKLIAAAIKIVLPDYTGHADLTWDLPLDILNRIESFGNWAVPREDQQPQIAALFLAIAPDLLDTLKDEKRFDVISAYYGYLILASTGSEGAKLNDLARVVPDQAERDQLIANRASLAELRKRFDVQRSNVQQRFGFKSDDAKVLKALVYEHEIAPKFQFKISGTKYELQQVFRKFYYNPPYGFEGTDAYRPPMMDGKTYGKDYQPTGALLFRILVEGRRFDVTDKDIELLTFYSNIIEQEANLIGLAEVAEYSQKFAEFTIDAVELVPGFGQGVAAARIVATVIQFLASGEWDDIKNLLTNDPKALLERVWEKLKEVLTPENLWIYLLFGSQLFDWLKSKVLNPREQRVAQSSEPTSRFGKLMARVRGIEHGLARAWDWLEDHVQLPLRTFQAFVLSHPVLSLILDLVADNLHRLVDLKHWLDSNDREGGFTSTIANVHETFKVEMETLVGSLQHLQLPERVVPTEQILEAVIELILNRLGTKGKVTRLVLGTLGILDEITKLINDELVAGSPADPNKYWKEDVIPLIEDKFDAVRDGLVNDIYDFLTNPPLALQMERPPVGQKQKIAPPEGDGFPEVAPYLDNEIPVNSVTLPRPGAGMPLPAVTRSRAERQFGHDFSHVRLHTGSEAAAVTGAFGAAGLTTGSHVYLNPALPAASPKGQQVFNHELTHVLQQTGPRPLGLDHNPTPIIGRPGGGLRYDPAQESAADRVSHSVAARTTSNPIDPGPLKSGGYQPAFLSIRTVRRFLRELTDVEKAKQAQREIDREALTGGKPDIDDDQLAIGTSIWDSVRKMISAGKLPTSAPNLEDIRSDFMSYFDGIAPDVGKVVPQIAFGVSEPVTEKAEGDNPPVTKRKLEPKRFVGGIEDYLLAKAGIVCSIKLNKENKAESAEIKNLLLEMVGSGSKLWTLAMSNASIPASDFEELRPLLRAKLRELNTKTSYIEIRASGFPALMHIWESSKFAFNSSFVDEVKQQAALSKIKDRPHDLPRYSDYIDYKSKAGGQIGVRIGKYGDSNQHGPDRESHHTTQFLLIEYFRNKSDNQPFPPKLRKDFNTLGISFSGSNAVRFKPPVGQAVEFEKLDIGSRGEAMPAILLSRPTHRGANLHVSGARADDFPDGGIPVTQGDKVHSTFLTELRAAGAGKIADAYPADIATLQNHVTTVGATVAGTQVYKAIQSTYGWMHNHMLQALEQGLRKNERDYYEEIVTPNHTDKKGQPDEHLNLDYDLQPDQMEPVYSAAEDNNDKVMRSMGWLEP